MVHWKMALLVKGAISFYLFNLFEKLGCFLSSIASDDRDGHGLAKNENWGAELPPTFWCRKTLLLMFSTIPVTSATSDIFCPQTTEGAPRSRTA